MSNPQETMDPEELETIRNCEHICSGNCRRVGCNCDCGEWHVDIEELEAKALAQEPNDTDDNSDYKEDNGNTPIGYPSDGPSWFGAK